MPSRNPSCVIGIDVGGTNTDAVILQNEQVLAWHKTPTTSDIQGGIELAIEEVVRQADVAPAQITSVKIGTTQFVNAVLERNRNKLDRVGVIRLCGPYSRRSPPFVDFPAGLRALVEGHHGYVDGGYQVDGRHVSTLKHDQLQAQAAAIRSKSIKSIVVIGIYSPSNPDQELEAASVLASELGPGYDISCSHSIGRLGFLERENASILNASLRRFARHVIAGFQHAVRKLGNCSLYITVNDGTLSKASEAASHPVRCFSSGPTNSARGAALLAGSLSRDAEDDKDVLVVDVGGTTTDICALLKTGFPRQSATFVKIAGVRTNFSIPDVYSIPLGGGSIVRTAHGQVQIGPDSVGSRLAEEGICFGGQTITATDLVWSNTLTETLVSSNVKAAGRAEMKRAVEVAIDLVKTRPEKARVILVGGGNIIIGDNLAGVGELIRPKHLEVANAVGAAIGKISGTVDTVVVPRTNDASMEVQIEEAEALAMERCIRAGGSKATLEVVEVELIPISYVTDGSTRLIVRVVADLLESQEEPETFEMSLHDNWAKKLDNYTNSCDSKATSYELAHQLDVEGYRPRIEGDLWYLSKTDLQFLQDGTGVLGVGSCGDAYPSYIACLSALARGEDITIRRQDSITDDATVLIAGFMGSPTVYLERIPGTDEITDAVCAVLKATDITSFDAIIPNEIGGMNAFEALLAAHHFSKSTLDTDCVFTNVQDNFQTEQLMRDACTELGSLSGICVNPLYGHEARGLPQNSYSLAWSIGRSIALARSRKIDPVTTLLQEQNGVLLFRGKISSVTRHVAKGFTRGTVLLASSSQDSQQSSEDDVSSSPSLLVEFENENLCAILKQKGEEDKVLAVCPDLICFLDMANGAPLGVSDYKFGLRVSVVALRSPPMWTTDKGLKMGGPAAFGLDLQYKPIGTEGYKPPMSVWDMFCESR
ncbi:Hydantoin utilization protein A [Cyphellophora attinorum]|uniref:Hydantoin utilization protein A n=1 Tax=Cyphellophora attinorum TaxID=1664694 RepID=A0A0N0NNF6_9EURO|nr:Hydantoin utilization protein A [Phialophora attinorum]KPI41319.1 Hydantoin utilization protein A [Phialophora attinorum]